MGGLLVQFLGLFALLGLVAWGYRHWISPRHVGIQGKGMLLLSVVTLVGGLLGSTGWCIDDPRCFSWDLPPLASRMLAVYLTPLLVTAPLLNLDRFDPAAPITYVY